MQIKSLVTLKPIDDVYGIYYQKLPLFKDESLSFCLKVISSYEFNDKPVTCQISLLPIYNNFYSLGLYRWDNNAIYWEGIAISKDHNYIVYYNGNNYTEAVNDMQDKVNILLRDLNVCS